MPVSPARSFETGMSFLQAGRQIATAWNPKCLIRAPAAGGETLCGQYEIESVAGCSQVFLTVQHQVGLRRGAKRVHMTVSVQAGQDISASAKGSK